MTQNGNAFLTTCTVKNTAVSIAVFFLQLFGNAYSMSTEGKQLQQHDKRITETK
jgi:hypothetical protein